MDVPQSGRFSLMNGGPAYRLMVRVGLGPSVVRRAVVLAVVTWVPLLISSGIRGVALGDRVRLPFLLDISAYARFLIAIPLLVLAERWVDRMLGQTVRQFTASGIIDADERPGFESAVGEMVRRRDSVLAEIVLLALALAGGLSFGRSTHSGITTWHAAIGWYGLISIPIYQFLLYRWLWRFAIWSAFLRRVSRMDLRIQATHPDLRGGLAFLGMGHASFSLIVLSAFIVFAGMIAVSVLYAGVLLSAYRTAAAALIPLVILFFVGPLFFFTPRLTHLKIASLLSYGAFASAYTQAFDRKWLRGETAEELLGNADVQSLADMSTGYGLVRAMRTAPFGLPLLLAYLLSAIVPLLPLAFIAFPADEVGRAVLGILRGILG